MSAPDLASAATALRMALRAESGAHEAARHAAQAYAEALEASPVSEATAAAARAYRAASVRALGAAVLVGETSTVLRTALAHARSAGEVL